MSKHYTQSESMKALEQSLNDHMEICSLRGKVKRLKAKNARLKAEVERLRKAGNEIIMITSQYVTDSTLRNLALREWNAAKEGKQP